MELKISIDDETFQKFVAALMTKGEARDVVIERMMLAYAETEDDGGIIGGDDIDKDSATKKLLDKFQERNIGSLANIVLRGLLERGVASESEIVELQKASGYTQLDKYHIQFGLYVSTEFGLAFPLLINKSRKEFDKPSKFYARSLKINGNEYYLCSQWIENLHRAKLEAWIRKHLLSWLMATDEQRRNEMIHWIKNQL